MLTKEELRELLMNACMHRDYQSNMPIRLYRFKDRIEIMNAGGLYGKARPENFPAVNDYRNPVIAEGMKNLKYVNMFNRGIDRVQTMLRENENKAAAFDVNKMSVFEVTVKEVKDELPLENKETIQVNDQVSDQVRKLIDVLNGEMSRIELMDKLKIKSVPYFRKRYIQPALELSMIELTQPDKPNSPTQKYQLTKKGEKVKKK